MCLLKMCLNGLMWGMLIPRFYHEVAFKLGEELSKSYSK
jgi:hypothetical protein